MGTCPSCRHHAERETPTKLTFGEKPPVVLIQHIGWFGLVSLDERTDVLSSLCGRCTREMTQKLSNDRIMNQNVVRTRSLVDILSCFAELLTCPSYAFLQALRKAQPFWQIRSRTETKKHACLFCAETASPRPPVLRIADQD